MPPMRLPVPTPAENHRDPGPAAHPRRRAAPAARQAPSSSSPPSCIHAEGHNRKLGWKKTRLSLIETGRVRLDQEEAGLLADTYRLPRRDRVALLELTEPD